MKVPKSGDHSSKGKAKLRNFDLTVEEIKLLKAIEGMTQALEDIERKNIEPERLEFFRSTIIKLEEKLEEVRENTLIR